MKKVFTPAQKAAVVLTLWKGEQTVNQVSSLYGVHPTQIRNWSIIAEQGLTNVFADKRRSEGKEQTELIQQLYQLIGQRDTELVWLKKNCTLTHSERTQLIEKEHPTISLTRQAALLDISRSSLYYQPRVNPEEQRLMNRIDQIYTHCPFYGSRKIRWALKNDYAVHLGREQVQRLMRLMGLAAIYPKVKPKTSQPNVQHRKYPYLLNNLAITRPNQVWGTDITYLKLETGCAYLTVILDWFSRYVISWQLSDTLEAGFCAERPCARRFGSPLRKSTTATRAANTPVWITPTFCSLKTLRSAWMGGAGVWITSLPSDCGAP
jgi:putative transposase